MPSENLETRFDSAKTVPGTQEYNFFVPRPESTMILRKYSSSPQYDIFSKRKIAKKEQVHEEKSEVNMKFKKV